MGWISGKTVRHSSILAFCLPEQLLLSSSGSEECGLVLQQLHSASAGQVPSPLSDKVPATHAAVCWSWRSSSLQITNGASKDVDGWWFYSTKFGARKDNLTVCQFHKRIECSCSKMVQSLSASPPPY